MLLSLHKNVLISKHIVAGVVVVVVVFILVVVFVVVVVVVDVVVKDCCQCFAVINLLMASFPARSMLVTCLALAGRYTPHSVVRTATRQWQNETNQQQG